MCVQQGTPSTCAEISSSSGPSDLYDSAGPPGMIDGPFERALLAAGDAGADEVQAALAHRLLAADRVGVERVAAVDDDVALVHHAGEFVDDGVGRVAGLDHDQHPARFLERRDEFVHRLGADELALGAVVRKQRIGFGDRAIVQCDGVAVAREVAGDVGAHHGQPGNADLRGAGGVCFRRRHRKAFRVRLWRNGKSAQKDQTMR